MLLSSVASMKKTGTWISGIETPESDSPIHLDDALRADPGQRFDLVLANIQAHVLRELLPGIAQRVAPGGTLVMSGLLSPQAEAVAEDYAAVGFTVEAIRPSAADPAWSSAVLRRPS